MRGRTEGVWAARGRLVRDGGHVGRKGWASERADGGCVGRTG